MFDITSFLLGLQKGKSMGGGSTETDIIPLQDATFTDNGNYYEWYITPAPTTLKAGETYHVKWGEQEYTLTAIDASSLVAGAVALGNLGIYGLVDTGEPFLFSYVPNWGGAGVATLGCLTLETDATRKVRVYQKARSDSGLVRYVTFIGALGNTLFEMPVLVGDDCKDPIDHKDIETPTKESTVSQVFTYNGWALTADGTADSNALKNVTEDRTVYAAFAVSARKYTVNFYDGETLLSTQQVAYGVTPTVTTPKKDGYSFDSWQPTLGAVEGDTDYYAQWIEKVTFSGGTWEDIIRVAESGQASEHFKVGDIRTEQLNYENGTSEIITLTVAGFDYDSIGSTSNKAGVSIISNVLATERRMMSSSPSQYGYYSQSELRTYLNGTVKKALPSDLQAAIKQVKKVSRTSASGSNNQTDSTSYEYVWLLSSSSETYTEATRYPIFTSNKSSRIAYKTDGTAANYWSRNGSGGGRSSWNYYNTLGDTSNQDVTQTCGVRFGFCI